MHIIAAQNVVRWARKRYDMGLGGFGYPWGDEENAWVVMGRSDCDWTEEGALMAADGGGDVLPRSLADPDSLFVECAGISVHYKETCTANVSRNVYIRCDCVCVCVGGGGGG